MINRILFSVCMISLMISLSYAQVGIGTNTPDASSILEIKSSNKGLLIPRLTTSQRNNINNPSDGLTIYNTTVNCIEYYRVTTSNWSNICDSNTPCNNPNPLNCQTNASITAGSSISSSVTGGGDTTTWSIAPTTGVSQSSGSGNNTGNITFSNTGTYTVTFRSRNTTTPSGCTPASTEVTCSRTIVVNSSTTPCNIPSSLNCQTNASIAAGNSVSSSVTGGGDTTTWSIAPTTGVSQSSGSGNNTGNITFSNAGTYTVTFRSRNTGTPSGCTPASTEVTCSRTIVVNSPSNGANVVFGQEWFDRANSSDTQQFPNGVGSNHSIIFNNIPQGTNTLRIASITGLLSYGALNLSVTANQQAGIPSAAFGNQNGILCNTDGSSLTGAACHKGSGTITINYQDGSRDVIIVRGLSAPTNNGPNFVQCNDSPDPNNPITICTP